MIDHRRRAVVVERLVAAAPAAVFAVLADPSRHAAIDGSGALRAGTGAHLSAGATFTTPMRRTPASVRPHHLLQATVAVLVGGQMRNTVVEYVPDRRIAWRNVGHHVWTYELTPVGGAATAVRETFDWSTNRLPRLIDLVGFPAANEAAMQRTLERLATLLEAPA